MMFPVRGSAPSVDRLQMVEVDRRMMDEYRIDLVRMMENAGAALAEVVLHMAPSIDAVTVCAGSGGNGGGALVGARRLACRGLAVTALTTRAIADLAPVTREQARLAAAVGVRLQPDRATASLGTPDVVVDGVIGYSLSGAPTGNALHLIRLINEVDAPVASLDVPSGVDATTGDVPGEAVVADATVAVALPKTGIGVGEGAAHAGTVYIADIGVPVALYSEAFGIDASGVFDEGNVVRLGS